MKLTNLVKVVCVVALLSLTGCVVAQTTPTHKEASNDTIPTLAMTRKDIQRCGMSILTPKLLGVPNATNCSSGNWKVPTSNEPGSQIFATVTTSYVSGYRTGDGPVDGNYPQDKVREISFLVYPVDQDVYFKSIEQSALRRRQSGFIYEPMTSLCGSDKNHQTNVSIIGQNWRGTLIEEQAGGSKAAANSVDCRSPSKYRCISMIIGNAKETAVLMPRCFLRKHADNLYHGLSFDIFMSMVKTIRFVDQ